MDEPSKQAEDRFWRRGKIVVAILLVAFCALTFVAAVSNRRAASTHFLVGTWQFEFGGSESVVEFRGNGAVFFQVVRDGSGELNEPQVGGQWYVRSGKLFLDYSPQSTFTERMGRRIESFFNGGRRSDMEVYKLEQSGTDEVRLIEENGREVLMKRDGSAGD